MRFGPAIAQAWDSLSSKAIDNPVRFLGEEYRVDDALTLLALH